jgi:hypothetical protein
MQRKTQAYLGRPHPERLAAFVERADMGKIAAGRKAEVQKDKNRHGW